MANHGKDGVLSTFVTETLNSLREGEKVFVYTKKQVEAVVEKLDWFEDVLERKTDFGIELRLVNTRKE